MFTTPFNYVYRLILRRAVGKFIKGELDSKQLDVAISSGLVKLYNLELDENVCSFFL